jgi:general secretion pathway protein G
MLHQRFVGGKNRRVSSAADRGMTLIEIMIVLALIALIASAIGVMVIHRYRDGQISAAQLQVKKLSQDVQQFMILRNRCPSIDDLIGAHFVRAAPRDPWGNAISVRCPGQHDPAGVDVLSYGPDKSEGTEDDVLSWKE